MRVVAGRRETGGPEQNRTVDLLIATEAPKPTEAPTVVQAAKSGLASGKMGGPTGFEGAGSLRGLTTGGRPGGAGPATRAVPAIRSSIGVSLRR